MVKLIRILIASALSMGLAGLGVKGNAAVLQTLFTVLGIVFSISMSLLVSFNLSKVLNKGIREEIRLSIGYTRNMLLTDFTISTIALVAALIWNENNIRYTLGKFTIDIMLLAILLIGMSLCYEIYNFKQLHKLHTDIEDAIIEEDTRK